MSRVRGKLNGFDWPSFDYYLASFLRGLRGLQTAPDVVVLFNDLVSSEYVKEAFPGATVIAWLHNECRTRHDMRRTIATTDVFLANSGYIRDWTISTHGVPANRLIVAHNGIDLEEYHPRKDYSALSDPVRVLFIGPHRSEQGTGPGGGRRGGAATRRGTAGDLDRGGRTLVLRGDRPDDRYPTFAN